MSSAELRRRRNHRILKMFKWILAVSILLCLGGTANAVCPASTSITTVTGTNTPYATSDDGAGNCEAKFNIDQVGGVAVVQDPCQAVSHVFTPINISNGTTATIVAGTSAKKTYVCHLFLAAPVSVSVGIIEGTGATCATGTAGVIGGTTAATGIPLTGGPSGFVEGDGLSAGAATATNADNLCFAFSSAQQVSGVLVTVQK
jgi:hypothetical protein